MDAIPVVVLLIPYLFIVVVASVFLFFNVFHLWRYGVEGTGTSLLIALYLILFAIIAGGGWLALSGFVWGSSFSLSDVLPRVGGASSFGL